MSEPVMRRTQSGDAKQLRTSAFRFHSPLANVLSLCSVLSVLSFVAPLSVQAATDASATVYSIPSAKAADALLLDIDNAGKRLVAVGDRGHILYSDDEGKTWTQAKVPSRMMLTAVAFGDDKHGWAVGHDALILATTDGGTTWTQQFSDQEREEGAPFLDVWFKDDSTGFAVGAYGALFATTDGGKNWEDAGDRLDNPDGYHLNAITEVKGSGLFVVGEMGSMFRSKDGGETWETLKGPYEGSLFGVLGTNEPGTVLAYGLRGNLFRSTDFGTTWTPIKVKSPRGKLDFGLSGGAVLKDGAVVIVGHGGSVLKSTDNGLTFSLINRPDRLSLSSVAADDKGDLVLVGQGGVHVTSPTGEDASPKQ
jgi:photosystem II stability/assembly factor-like uncharacterized protein